MVALRGQRTLLFQLDEAGDRVVDRSMSTELDDEYGRVRSGPDGALYVTTCNGTDDRLLRITPRT